MARDEGSDSSCALQSVNSDCVQKFSPPVCFSLAGVVRVRLSSWLTRDPSALLLVRTQDTAGTRRGLEIGWVLLLLLASSPIFYLPSACPRSNSNLC